MKEFVINNLESGQSVEKYFKKLLPNAPLSFIFKVLRKKDIKINGKKVEKDVILNAGDLVQIYIDDKAFEDYGKTPNLIKSNTIKPWIIYEDENILIIDKPRGIPSQSDLKKGIKGVDRLVLEYLYFTNFYNPDIDKAFTPSIAHRLDQFTSGIMLIGKNIETLHELAKLIKDKDNLKKYYLTLVVGHIKSGGTIDAPIVKNSQQNMVFVDKEKGKEAITKYKVIKEYKDTTLLEVELLSGRTHQIRAHMSYISHPVVGDNKYGDFIFNDEFKNKYHFTNQFLIAYKITFNNTSGILKYLKNKTFEISLNEEYKNILRNI